MGHPYDRHYYLTSCGQPYERTERWLTFFQEIADHIVKDIAPKTVLDAGCAKGFLVEALRDRGVDAYGIDISEYAIGEVRADIRQFCRIGSILEPLDKNYDLIISIEVMEHLSPEEGKKAIENLCHFTDDIIFSSTPSDFKEATHQNVQPPEYWAEVFVRHGFVRDIDYDAGYINEHAIRFIRTRKKMPAIIRDYERKNYIHTLENKKLRELSLDMRDSLSKKDTHIANLEALIENLRSHSKSNEDTVAQLSELLTQQEQKNVQLLSTLSSIDRSITWTIVTKFHRIISKIMPSGTGRRHFYDKGIFTLRFLIHEGLHSTLTQIKNRLRWGFSQESLQSFHPVLEISIEKCDGNVPQPLDNPLTGCFISPMNRLHSIEILTGTYERRNADLQLIIRDSSLYGPIIREALIRGNKIKNNDYSRFEFRPILDSKEKKYSFQIISTASPSAAVWYNPGISDEKLQLYMAGTRIDGCIGFRCFSEESIMDSYHRWIIQNEPTNFKIEAMREESNNFSYQPKISIIMPVWNTDEKWLRYAIDSVIKQIYGNWELCISDDGSTNSNVHRTIKEYADLDKRIKVLLGRENRGISENSNKSLSLATGDFIALLDHDDALAPFSLYEVVKLLNENPGLHFIYSDEDKIDSNNIRMTPFFKPDWSPDLFLSCNYLCHLSVIRKDLTDSLIGFREDFDGSQDYDLFLRVIERCDKENIAHIPKILYHWRIIPGSIAASPDSKQYAYSAAKKALSDSLRRRNVEFVGVFDGFWRGSYRVQYKITKTDKVSIIIPSRDNVNILKRCISSIFEKTEYDNFEIVIVDNQSNNEDTLAYYKEISALPRIRILQYDNQFNFSSINNYAVSQTDGKYLIFMNNDTIVISEEWLTAMLEHAQRNEVGAVGAKLLYPDNRIQHAGVILGIRGVAGHSHKYYCNSDLGYFGRIQTIQNVSAVTAACMMLRREVFEEVGGFDEDLAVAFNDVDLCLKIRSKSYLLVYTPYAVLYHHESLSRGYEDSFEKQNRFQDEVMYIKRKWGDIINAGDPYYNPNLTLENEDFSIKI